MIGKPESLAADRACKAIPILIYPRQESQGNRGSATALGGFSAEGILKSTSAAPSGGVTKGPSEEETREKAGCGGN